MTTKQQKLDEELIVFETITGSVSRGLNIESSDEDRKGIFMPTKEEIFSLGAPIETICIHEPEDREYHTLKKFMSLVGFKANPTILEMLFTEERFITKKNPIIDRLLSNRDMFLTQNTFYSFQGYAKDQLMRIKNLKATTTNEERSEHLEYVLERMISNVGGRYSDFETNTNTIALNDVYIADDLQASDKHRVKIDLDVKGVDVMQLKGLFSEIGNTVNTYQNINRRNKKNSEERLWKHAMQLSVLIKMGTEILRGDGLNVYRENDKQEFLDIRNGNLSWDEFYLYVDDLTRNFEYEKENSPLPKMLEKEKANALYKELMEEYYYNAN